MRTCPPSVVVHRPTARLRHQRRLAAVSGRTVRLAAVAALLVVIAASSVTAQPPPPGPNWMWVNGRWVETGGIKPVRPPTTSADRRWAARFLEQASFGPTAEDMALVESQGPTPWIEQQLALPETQIPDDLDLNQLRARVFLNMATAPDQLRQRMIFALSQIVVVSAKKVNKGDQLTPWVRLLSRHAFGNYRALLRDVALSPSMGKYLDLANSRKAKGTNAPNENFPRELLQLFSIGVWELNQDGTLKLDAQGYPIPAYTQAVVADIARALTGWTYPTMPGATPVTTNPAYFVGDMEPRAQNHDTGAKTLLRGVSIPAGQTVTKDLDDVIDAVFQHPNTPPFVATRLIRFLVTSNPSPAYIRRVADVFVNNGTGTRGDLAAVVRAVLSDAEAGASAPHDGRLKDPILHIIGLGRALNAEITDPAAFQYLFSNLGELVLTPTTVFSFYSPLGSMPDEPGLFGPEFQIYTPALAIQRANVIYKILAGQLASSFKVDLTPFVTAAGDSAVLVEAVNQALLQGRMSNDLRRILTRAAQATSNLKERAIGALYLAAISSEYSVHAGGAAQ